MMTFSAPIVLLLLLQGTSPLPPFTRILQLGTTPDTAANVSIGDVNGDGRLDLLVVKGRHWPGMSRVMLGDGRGHFPTAWNLGDQRYRSYSGRLVDLDRDGDLDVVLSNDAPDPKVVFTNDGTGHFTRAGAFGEPGWEMRNAAIADLNGDSLPDIVPAIRAESASQYVCLATAGGRYDGGCRAFALASATTITPADLNHDGLIDLVVPHRDGGQSYGYLNDGKGGFGSGRAVPFGPKDATIRMAAVADLDRDGGLDILVIDERRGAGVYFGRADGSYSEVLRLDDGKVTPYGLAVADLNRDGAPDIVVGNVEAPTTIYYNDGSGRRFTRIHAGDSRGAVYGFAIADLDGDGWVDIAVARSEAPSLVMFGGDGSCVAPCSAQAQVVNIWPGIAPGSEAWTHKERVVENTPLGTVVFNVVTPTLTAYLPEPAKATGTGVIIAPGGAFVALAIDLEGNTVARWLQERGIAAFVLKYRLVEKKQDGIPQMDMDTAGRYGIADGIQAIRVVRQRAAEWGVSPDRVGFLGFSAGAMVASGTLLPGDSAARPDFGAMIYGAPFGVMPAIPAKLPPMFLAWAQDDPVALDPMRRFYGALTSAGHKPEVHIFSAGGHGFGLKKQGTSSDHWIEALWFWLEAQRLTKRAG